MQESAAAGRTLPSGERLEDSLPAKAAAFAANPSFPAALRAYTISFIGFRQNSGLVNKIVSYHARWRVAGFLLYLHADRERFGPDGGATYGRLVDMCGRKPEVSKRSLKTLLALLQLSGMVTTKRSSHDGRSKVYQPTARMQGFMSPWLTYATTTLDLLEPRQQRARALEADAGFRDKFLVSMGRWHETATPLVERMPDYTAFFGGRDGAGAVLLAVMLADMDGTPVPSRAALSKVFGLSKTQVTSVLREGEALGYFALDDAGVATPTARLREDFRAWVALELAFYAEHMPTS